MSKNLIPALQTAFADGRRHSELAIVLSVNAGTTHTADLEVITPGSAIRTGEVLQNVPLSPIWAGQNGEGIYAPPAVNAQVIVAFLQGNPAYPYVAQPYNRNYSCAPHTNNALTIATKHANLGTLIYNLLDELMKLQTQGGPTTQLISGATVAKLAEIKINFTKLFGNTGV